MITIRHVSDTSLYRRYPNQSAPQPCHVELALRVGALTAAHDPEVESGAPADVSHGHTRRWAIPPLKEAAANTLLERIAPLAERVDAGHFYRWNGTAHVAAFDADALAALNQIELLCDATFAAKADHIVAERAEDWFRPTGPTLTAQASFLGITSATTDDVIEVRAEIERRVAESYGVDVIDGLDDYLRMLRRVIQEAA